MARKRRYQVVSSVEATAGTETASLISAANATLLVIDPQFTINPEIFSRSNINRASNSPQTPLAGVRTGTLTFGVELAGASGTPPWADLMRACGFKQFTTVAIQIGAITDGSEGPFQHGETVTGGTSGATGTVMHDTRNGAGELLIGDKTGNFQSAETLTGGTSGATATSSSTLWAFGNSFAPYSDEVQSMTLASLASGAPVDGDLMHAAAGSGSVLQVIGTWSAASGQQCRVINDTPPAASDVLTNLTASGNNATVDGTPAFALDEVPSLTIGLVEDGVLKTLKGARGTVSLAGGIGEASILQFSFTGLIGTVESAGVATGVTYTSKTPPVLLGATMAFGDSGDTAESDEGLPRFHSYSFDMGNPVAIGRDASNADGVYGSAHLGPRGATGSVTLDVEVEETYDFYAKLKAGTPSRIRMEIGSEDEKHFRITSPSLVFTGESGGEVEGNGTRDLPFQFASVDPNGTEVDNAEFVLSYGDDVAP